MKQADTTFTTLQPTSLPTSQLKLQSDTIVKTTAVKTTAQATAQLTNQSQSILRPNFWQHFPLNELTDTEWEALCDGCGVCCLVKFLDDDTPAHLVEYTDVACQLLDCQTGHCQDYANRQVKVPDCIQLTVTDLPKMLWLPDSCAYKRLYRGQSLPNWHPLITQDKVKSAILMKQANIGAAGRCVPEPSVSQEQIEERVVHWVQVS